MEQAIAFTLKVPTRIKSTMAKVYKSEKGCESLENGRGLWEWERFQEFIKMREVARVHKNERGCKSS